MRAIHRAPILALTVLAASVLADTRVNIHLGAGHPIRRPARTVVVRRTPVVVRTPVVYVAPVVWTRAVVTLPPRNRMVWEDSETIRRREDWVDTYFNVDNTGDALFLTIQGRAQIDFAEVQFRNGQVQVVDFHEDVLSPGTYRLIDFPDGRQITHVRMVARARTPNATFSVLMKK